MFVNINFEIFLTTLRAQIPYIIVFTSFILAIETAVNQFEKEKVYRFLLTLLSSYFFFAAVIALLTFFVDIPLLYFNSLEIKTWL